MNIKTKFDLKDKVFTIGRNATPKEVKCELCSGHGIVGIGTTDRTIGCPDCYGHGYNSVWVKPVWSVGHEIGKIGKITVELYDKNDKDHEDRYMYMLDITGVGSGTCWDEDRLFLTEVEALLECEKRNELIEKST